MKEKLKVYHGLPKTPTTANTLFYASFDGNAKSNLGDVYSKCEYVPSITGYGAKTVDTSVYSTLIPLDNKKSDKKFTFDFWAYLHDKDCDFLNVIDKQNASSSNKVPTQRCMTVYYNVAHGLRLTYFYPNSYDSVVFYTVPNTIKLGWTHVRLLVDGLNIKLYVNGKFAVSDNIVRPFDSFFIGKADGFGASNINCPISDFHITSDYMGDYFPTLPQDFIDGKAIVVPALNQRQSYGDPILHQVTELLVPANNEGENHYPTLTSDELFWQSKSHAELGVNDAVSWGNGTGIRIIGLENSLITGVYDTDTAKCRITKTVTNTKIVPVSSVSGINVGDTLQYVKASNFTTSGSSYNYTVESVDSVNNTVTLSSTTTWYAGDFFFETTASSSSPVIKTVDGTVVNGTWSGLGTNVATFTFGSNSNIAEKDLVVTYCLNAKGNVSPYSKMPSEVIRGYDELGNEYLPTSTLTITDDFKGKISGSVVECPHKLSYALDTTLRLPNQTWNEFSNSFYQLSPTFIASPTKGHIAQTLIEIDLVKLVETKLGVEITGDKLKWLNENTSNIRCYALAKGQNDINTNCYIKYFHNNGWLLNSGSSCTNTTSSLKEITGVYTTTGNLTSTKYYFIVHNDALTVAGDDSTKTRITLQDLRIELTLKTDSRYDYLYGKDNYSRGIKNNPIMIDKQTKEVKRFAPSRKPFSTEVIVYNPTTLSASSSETILCQSPHGFVTTQGSGSSAPVEDVLRGLIGKLGISSYRYINEDVISLPVTGFSQRTAKNMYVHRQFYPTQFGCYEPKELPDVENCLFIAWDIIALDKTLYLKTHMYSLNEMKQSVNGVTQYYEIPNRPLIK